MALNDDVEVYTLEASTEVEVITISAGTQGPPGEPGPQGPAGNAGVAGPANTLTVGTTTTGAAGSNAIVTITGSAPNQTINFTIPRGNAGANGTAALMSIGTVTTLASGASATATVTGTAPNYVLNLGLPAGAKGDTGNTGLTGPANTLTIGTVTTGAAGASATATITGTAPNQTLNLTIPQGIQGNAGAGAPDATTTAKGSIQLAGDLGGTADAPTVPAIQSATNAGTASTLVKRDASGQATFVSIYLTGTQQTASTAATRKDYVDAQVATRAATSHTHTASQISDSTTVGRSVLTAADAATARTAIGAGTSSLVLGTAAGTAAAGNDSRLSDARTPLAHTHVISDLTATGTRDATTFLRGDGTWAIPAGTVTAANITDATTVGRSVLTAADAAAARTVLGAGTSSLTLGTTSTTALAGNYAPTKATVGLANVDNTADTAKPVSTAQQAAIDSVGTRVTTLEGFGKVLVLTAAAAVPAGTPANTIIFRSS